MSRSGHGHVSASLGSEDLQLLFENLLGLKGIIDVVGNGGDAGAAASPTHEHARLITAADGPPERPSVAGPDAHIVHRHAGDAIAAEARVVLRDEVVTTVADTTGADLLAARLSEGLAVVVCLGDHVDGHAAGDQADGVILLEEVISNQDVATALQLRTAHFITNRGVAEACTRNHVLDGERPWVVHGLREHRAPAILSHRSALVHLLMGWSAMGVHLN